MSRFLPVLLFLTALAAPAAGQDDPSGSAGAATLQPGDSLRVEIWREEELSGSFLVDERGIATLPLLGDVPVSSIPLADLRGTLLERYRRDLRNPSINITPLRSVYILGEVNEPGLYSVNPTVSLAGVVALAGGASSSGDLGNIKIVRSGAVVNSRLRAEASLAGAAVRSGDQIFVERRSWMERNSTFLVSAMLSVPSIIATILALR